MESKRGTHTGLGHINGNLYHYAGNNPVMYTDPTGMFDFWEDSKTGFTLLFTAAKNVGNTESAKNVSDFVNSNHEFLGVMGATGLVAGMGYGVYSLCPTVKSFVDKSYNFVVELNNDLLSLAGIYRIYPMRITTMT